MLGLLARVLKPKDARTGLVWSVYWSQLVLRIYKKRGKEGLDDLVPAILAGLDGQLTCRSRDQYRRTSKTAIRVCQENGVTRS